MTITAIPQRLAVALTLTVAAFATASATAFAADTLVVVSSGTTSMPAGSQGTLNGVDQYELRGPNRTKPGLAIPGPATGTRTIATTSGSGTLAAAGKKAKSQPVLLTDWLG